jgi:hypothetical protein
LLIFLRRSAHFSTETEVNQRFGRNGQLNEIPAKISTIYTIYPTYPPYIDHTKLPIYNTSNKSQHKPGASISAYFLTWSSTTTMTFLTWSIYHLEHYHLEHYTIWSTTQPGALQKPEYIKASTSNQRTALQVFS